MTEDHSVLGHETGRLIVLAERHLGVVGLGITQLSRRRSVARTNDTAKPAAA